LSNLLAIRHLVMVERPLAFLKFLLQGQVLAAPQLLLAQALAQALALKCHLTLQRAHPMKIRHQ